MKNKEEEMRLQLLNKQIIDEREEGLANKIMILFLKFH